MKAAFLLTIKKSNLPRVAGSVKAKELMERPIINVEQSLAGKIAGVNVKDFLKIGAAVTYRKKFENGVNDANGSYNVIRNIV